MNDVTFEKLFNSTLVFLFLNLNTVIDDNSRYFSVPFEVADIKYGILGTPFFEDNIQIINKRLYARI